MITDRKPISQQLIDRLRREGWINKNAEVKFRRLYPGHWQRSAGAWVWTVEGIGVDIGSSWTARECLHAKRLSPGVYGEIVPEDK